MATTVQGLDRLEVGVRGVGVALDNGHALVAGDGHDAPDVDAGFQHPRRERVPQVVEPRVFDLSTAADLPPSSLEARETLSGSPGKDPVGVGATWPFFERRAAGLVERDPTAGAVLGLRQIRKTPPPRKIRPVKT